MPDRLLGLAVGRVKVGHAGRLCSAPWPIIPGIGEELACLGPATPWIQDRSRCLIGKELLGRLQPLEQPLVDRLQEEGGFAHPVGEC